MTLALHDPPIAPAAPVAAPVAAPAAAPLTGAPVRVAAEPWNAALAAEWDDFVRQAPGGTLFHLAGWRRVVEEVFGHRAHYLVARRSGTIAGVLPLFELRSLLFGRSLVSVPYAIAGGIVSDDPREPSAPGSTPGSTPGSNRALLDAARALAGARRVDYLELRSERPASPELLTKDLYATFRADLRQPEDALLKRMDRKRRQMLTYTAKAGYGIRHLAGEAAVRELPLFHRLFAQSMRRHGTPVYPRRFLAAVLAHFPGAASLLLATHQGRTVGGLLNLVHRGVITPFYVGIEDAAARLRGLSEFLHWQALLWGREQGCHTYDFGRSKRGTGAFDYKQRWGMDEVPLAYQYHLVRARELPNVSPANPRYGAAIRLWQRLPLPVTRLLGPPLIKRIP
jgi:FemAB-related protein (PEP-CTERM system-associated)